MGTKWLSRYAFLSYALLQCVLGDVTFTSSPGIIRTHGTQPVTLVWTLSQLTGYESGAISKDNVKMVTYQWGTPSYVNGNNNSKVSFNMDTHSGRITVTIRDVSEDDAGHYALGQTPSGQELITNNDAVIYLYGKPTKPSLPDSPIDIVEGRDLELTCNSTSTSLPARYRQPLQYIWFNKQQDITSSPPDRHHISGNKLTLENVHRTDAAIYSYRCQAYEARGLTSDKSTSSRLNVLYKPGAAQLRDTQTPLIEKEDELGLTCDLNDPGNPEPEYHWHNLDTGFTTTTQMNNNLVILAVELTVGQHDGRWQCWAQNTAGQGDESSPLNIIINAANHVQEDLPSQTAVSSRDTLSVTCSFKAKPPAQVTWTYSGSTEGLPPGVHSHNQDHLQGKYTVTSSTLSWSSSSTESDKREAAGSYTCHASNSVGSAVSSRSMILDVQYGPFDMQTEPEGMSLTYNETQQVLIMCRADCNPRCSFTWTRDRNNLWKSNGYQLNIRSVSRNHSDIYTCYASNEVDSKNLYVDININYRTDIKSFQHSASGPDIMQGTEVSLTCSVDSQPGSTINLLESYKSLRVEQDAQTLYYTFPSIHVTNSSIYRCTASNVLGPRPPALKYLDLDVKGPIEKCNDPDTYIGKLLNGSLLLEICLTANPFPPITESDWNFVSDDSNTSSPSGLPGQVAISTIETDHKYKRIIQFEIICILKSHYGTYSLRKKNRYGPSDDNLFTFKLQPEGEVGLSAVGRTIVITAVSVAASSLITGLAWMIVKRQRRKKQRPEAALIKKLPAPATEQRSTPSQFGQYEVCTAPEPSENAPAFYEPLPKEDEYEDVRSIQGHHNTGGPESNIQDVYLTTKADVVYYNMGGDGTKPRDCTTEHIYTEVVE